MRVSEPRPAPLTFAFPYHEISGVPVLFSRMARELAANGVAVDVIDYADGYMASQLGGMEGVRLVPFTPGTPVHVGPGTQLVLQSILPATIARELKVDPATRLFFWTLHPMNLVQAVLPIDRVRDLQARHAAFHRVVGRTVQRRLTAQLRGLVQSMHAAGSIAFMDGETLDATCTRLEIDLEEPLFLPVCCSVPASNTRPDRPGGDPFAFAWLGRLGDFKIHILLRTMTEAAAYARARRRHVVFHVIGDGPEREQVRPQRFQHEYFTVEHHGVLAGAALEDFLLRRVDMLAAMGTSALEGAKLGVPTVLLDVAYGPVPSSYRFRWLYESERYTLGRFVDHRCLEPGNDSLPGMIDAVSADPRSMSSATYEYCRRNHSIETVASRFLAASRAANFRWADMDPALRQKGVVRIAYETVREWRRTPVAQP